MVMTWVKWPKCPPESHRVHNNFLFPCLVMTISTQRTFQVWKLRSHSQVDWKARNRSFSSCQATPHLGCEFSFGKCWRNAIPFTACFVLICVLVQAAITNTTDWMTKTSNMYFPEFWRLRSPISRCQQIPCVVKTLFLVGRWLPSGCVLTWCRERGALVSFSSYKETNLIVGAPPS